MEKITESAAFFNVADTLECGQIFRYERRGDKFLVHSRDKSCLAYNEGGRAVVLAEEGDGDYFYRFFDLAADYGACYRAAKAEGGVLADAAERGRGIRILRQDAEETLFSFIVSQNNHIPRIRKILFRLCEDAGGRHEFAGGAYGSFPKAAALAERELSYYAAAGLGYRGRYVKAAAEALVSRGGADGLASLPDRELKSALLSFEGVGPKVADCVALFGFHRFGSFPVDTWIYKLYKEDYGGAETDRSKVSDFFSRRFGQNAGIFQQYLFHHKRTAGKN